VRPSDRVSAGGPVWPALARPAAPRRTPSRGRYTPSNPFKGRQFPGEVNILCVRWRLRYPLAYEHVAELLAEHGVEKDPSCIWRWVQA
jgi:hypothetical protein